MGRQIGLFEGVPAEHRAEAETLLGRVRRIMAAGQWWTLRELAVELEATWGHVASDASISARLRDLRKVEHGAWIVERRRRAELEAVVYEYQARQGVRP
jgi:hypothetical protein